MTNEEIIKRLEAIALAELVVDGLKVGAITKEAFEAIQETARLAISVLSSDRWISVEERLPEKADIYLCTLKSFSGNFHYIDVLKYIGGFFYENGVGTDRVTHWRPLPEPPKEDKP